MRTHQTPDNTKSGFPGWDSALGAVVSCSQAELDCNSQHFERNELSEGRGLNVYNYIARVYDPQIGRWWSVDPLTSLQESFSAYHFCYNNPVMFTEKTGLIPEGTELRSVDFSAMYSSNTLTQVAIAGMHLLNTPSAREINKRVEDAHRKGKDFGYDRDKKEWGYYGTEHRMSWDENPIKGSGQPTNLRSFETINTWIPLLSLNGGAATGGAGLNYTDRLGTLDCFGYGVDLAGYAAGLETQTIFKYGQRINGAVKSATQLTAEYAAFWKKVGMRLNITGGIIGVVDCGMQSYDDFSNGNYGLGAYEALKATSYASGTGMLFTPLSPIGAGILVVTGMVDIVGDVGLYIYGRSQ